jgi:hypothetical protein
LLRRDNRPRVKLTSNMAPLRTRNQRRLNEKLTGVTWPQRTDHGGAAAGRDEETARLAFPMDRQGASGIKRCTRRLWNLLRSQLQWMAPDCRAKRYIERGRRRGLGSVFANVSLGTINCIPRMITGITYRAARAAHRPAAWAQLHSLIQA